VSEEIAEQVMHSEWKRVKPRRCDALNKDNLLHTVLTGVNVQMIPVSNRYSAFKLLHDKDGNVTILTTDHKTQEREGVTKETFLDSIKQQGVQHVQSPTRRRQDTVDEKRVFRIPTIISGTASTKNDTPLSSRNHTKKVNKRVSTETSL
jgi:hypothetical protein